MARKSQISKDLPKPLESSRGALDRRWRALNESISAILGIPDRGVQFEADYQSGGVWAGLVGRACERVDRERGAAAFVAPLLELPKELVAWLGIQEVWDEVGAQRYIFHHLSLTVHFGFVGDPLKPQVFRSEWAGFRDWTGGGAGFQSPGSGHPHWQFDLNSSLRAISSMNREAPFERAGHTEEFKVGGDEVDVLALVRCATLERMHFASAAPWWKAGTEAYGSHMNAPMNEASLTNWLLESIRYLRQELGRCEIAVVE